jgi:hypothetical protein
VSAGPVATASPEGARVPAAQSVRVTHQTRVQRVRDARNVLEGFRVREAPRQQEVKRLQDSEEERCAITIIQRDFFQGLEVQRVQEAIGRREAQRVYDEKLAENEQRVHDRKRVHEAAHARFTAAIDAFSRQHKRARTPESVVGEVVEEQVVGEVVEEQVVGEVVEVEVEVVGEVVEVQVVGEVVEEQVVGEVVEVEVVGEVVEEQVVGEVVEEQVIEEGLINEYSLSLFDLVGIVDRGGVVQQDITLGIVEIQHQLEVPLAPPVPTGEALLQAAEKAVREATAHADSIRHNIFLQARETTRQQLVLSHDERVRDECRRVDEAVLIAPVEYILLNLNGKRHDMHRSFASAFRVVVGECNITVQNLPNESTFSKEMRGDTWRHRWGGKVVPWGPVLNNENTSVPGFDVHGNCKFSSLDPGLQDDVYILPHFREEISHHMERHSVTHHEGGGYFDGCHSGLVLGWNLYLDESVEVTLKFLSLIKKLNRREFATISG